MSMTTLRRTVQRSAAAGADDIDAMVSLFEAVGWPRQRIIPRTTSLELSSVLQLSLSGMPRVVVARTADGGASTPAVAAGYSSEAAYTIEWTPSAVRLIETGRWRNRPGDFELARALTDDITDLHALLLLVSPEEVTSGGLTRIVDRPPAARSGLADHLADQLTALRVAMADVAAVGNREVGESDLRLLRLFHRLLYVRFHEDRHREESLLRLADLVNESDPRAALDELLTSYTARHDSQLFDAPAVEVTKLPTMQLRRLLKALTEPWETLRLDFGLTQADVAGRLYQSYLQRRPTRSVRPEALFPGTRVTDERAALGAYYTPPALARRVVDEALGAWLRERRPRKPTEIRVLDPACGSGAFLVAALRALRSYFEGLKGRPLEEDERREILTHCLYGADIDAAATLLARAQLLEEADLTGRLPELSDQIVTGDSLLAPPSYSGGADGAVDWASVGNFDVVVTNPPFQSQLAQHGGRAYRSILRHRYPHSSNWGVDAAYWFVDLSLQLLKPGGFAGFVLPRKLLRGESAAGIRTIISSERIRALTDFRGLHAFPRVHTYICTVLVGPPADKVEVSEVPDSRIDPTLVLDDSVERFGRLRTWQWPRAVMRDYDWLPFVLRWEHDLVNDLTTAWEPLVHPGARREVAHGTQTGANERLIVPAEQVRVVEAGQVEIAGVRIPGAAVPRYARGPGIKPFSLTGSERLIVPFTSDGGRASLSPPMRDLIDRLGGMPPHAQPGRLDLMLAPKIILRAFGQELAAAADTTGTWITTKGTGGGLVVSLGANARSRLEAGAALLNSSLYQWLLRGRGEPRRDESVEVLLSHVEGLPWPRLGAAEWRALATAGRVVQKTWTERDPATRTARYWESRRSLDELVFELLGVLPRLRAVVNEELIRPG